DEEPEQLHGQWLIQTVPVPHHRDILGGGARRQQQRGRVAREVENDEDGGEHAGNDKNGLGQQPQRVAEHVRGPTPVTPAGSFPSPRSSRPAGASSSRGCSRRTYLRPACQRRRESPPRSSAAPSSKTSAGSCRRWSGARRR